MVITEGEYDAMAVYQATGIPAISLPFGSNSLPEELVNSISRFEKVFLWLDADEAGQMNAEKFVAKLGVSRTKLVTTKKVGEKGPKDANDVLIEDQGAVIKYLKDSHK
jgi:twinkle protein